MQREGSALAQALAEIAPRSPSLRRHSRGFQDDFTTVLPVEDNRAGGFLLQQSSYPGVGASAD